MTLKSVALVCLCSGLISACSSVPNRLPTSANTAPSSSNRPAPTILREKGLESVIGQRASSLARRFGTARIDLAEGDARKLQFTSATCVLDVFLYPLEQNAVPVATHVEARERIGGNSADRVRCIEEVERSVTRP